NQEGDLWAIDLDTVGELCNLPFGGENGIAFRQVLVVDSCQTPSATQEEIAQFANGPTSPSLSCSTRTGSRTTTAAITPIAARRSKTIDIKRFRESFSARTNPLSASLTTRSAGNLSNWRTTKQEPADRSYRCTLLFHTRIFTLQLR